MSDIRLPVNFISIGEIEPDDVKVYIHKEIYEELEQYARSDIENELGTILIGDYTEEHGKMHVIITDYIEAKYTDASASTLTFTHETWDYVQKEHEEKNPDKKIIGWQHTHPSYGIFLSNYDLFIQNNFFDMPFQIAYVIDPIQNIRGFFGWKNDETKKLGGFYIYDEVGKPIEIKSETKKKSNLNDSEYSKAGNVNKLVYAALAITTLVMLILLVVTINLNNKYNIVVDNQKKYESKIKDKDEIIDNQKNKIDNFKKNKENDTVTNYKIVTVKKGDNMYKICKRNGLDYEKHIAEIQKLNNYIDLNMIDVGQAIKLPKKK